MSIQQDEDRPWNVMCKKQAMNDPVLLSHSKKYASYVAFGAAVVLSLSLLLKLVSVSYKGFDLTDESFYLIWIVNPWNYEISATQFGFIYNPLLRLAGGDLVLVRQFNVLITFTLAFLLGAVFLGKMTEAVFQGAGHLRGFFIFGLSFSFASTALLFFAPWLPTPNYNSLGLQALLLAGAGAVLAEREWSNRSIVGWCLIGVAGWLSFMAKPTSAVALGIAIGVYAIVGQKVAVRLLLLSAGVALVLLVVSAWFIDGSIIGFAQRLLEAAKIYELVGAGHTLSNVLRVDFLKLNPTQLKIYVVLVLFASFLLLAGRNGRSELISWIALIIVCGTAIFLLFAFGKSNENLKFVHHVHVSTIFAASAFIFAVLAFKDPSSAVRREGFALALLFFTFPYVYAIGTASNYWVVGSKAGIFWILSGISLLSVVAPRERQTVYFLSLIVPSQLVTVAVLIYGFEHPYRQPEPLRLSHATVSLGEGGSQLRVAQETAAYIEALRRIARENGFTLGDPLIDLTGRTPGAAVILGAKAVGQPWLPGGYRGSRAFAEAVLDSVSCDDIARAWVLTEPSGRRALPSDVLTRYGLDLSRDFLVAGALLSPERVYQQVLLKPSHTREQGERACENRRDAVQ